MTHGRLASPYRQATQLIRCAGMQWTNCERVTGRVKHTRHESLAVGQSDCIVHRVIACPRTGRGDVDGRMHGRGDDERVWSCAILGRELEIGACYQPRSSTSAAVVGSQDAGHPFCATRPEDPSTDTSSVFDWLVTHEPITLRTRHCESSDAYAPAVRFGLGTTVVRSWQPPLTPLACRQP